MKALKKKGDTMTVISFMNQKGGVGKTTLAAHFAYMLKMNGEDVIIADTDPQSTLSEWDGLRANLSGIEHRVTVVNISKSDVLAAIREMNTKYKYVVVDGAPNLQEHGRAILAASDLVVMPTRPSGPDVRSTKKTVDMVKEIQYIRPELKACFILNAKKTNTQLFSAIQRQLEAFDVPLVEQTVGDRTIYAEGLSLGYTAMEIDTNPRSKHHIEMTRIVEGIMRQLRSGEVVQFAPAASKPKPQSKVKKA